MAPDGPRAATVAPRAGRTAPDQTPMTTFLIDGTAADAAIDPTWTVDRMLSLAPVSVAVFDAFDIDTCCDGATTLDDAARLAHVELPALVDALGEAVRVASLLEEARLMAGAV